MSLFNQSFRGSRLREAREARALSQVALAELVGVTRQSISQYEAGNQSPSSHTLTRLAEALNVRPHFFMMSQPKRALGTRFYRSMASATKEVRERAERRYEWLLSLSAFIEEYVRFPAIVFPAIDVPHDPRAISTERIEEAAGEVRRFWGLGNGPISNVVWLLENNGAVVVRHELASDKLDAFSEWGEKGRPHIVLATDKQSAARSRFDVAHELGHLILHRYVTPTAMKTPELFNLIEEQAHRFASAFLLPEQTFPHELYSVALDPMIALKSRWRVSIGAMIVRAEQLGLVSHDEARRLWINRTRRGWRTNEPLDQELEPERPRLLRRALELILRRGVTNRQDLEVRFGLPIETICDLLDVPLTLLDDADAPLRLRFPPGRPGEPQPKYSSDGEEQANFKFPKQA